MYSNENNFIENFKKHCANLLFKSPSDYLKDGSNYSVVVDNPDGHEDGDDYDLENEQDENNDNDNSSTEENDSTVITNGEPESS